MVILREFHYPESPVMYEQSDTRAILNNRDLGLGTVYVSERTLCWKEYGNAGFCVEYPHISMHAITSDPQVYASECVFIMIDGLVTLPGPNEEEPPNERNAEDDDDTESEPNITQLLLVPPNQNAIRSIYTALSQCQLLNPDPEDMIDEDDNVYEDAEDYLGEFPNNDRLNDLGAGGDTDMNHLSAQLHNHSIHANYSNGNGDNNFDDDQFEDAD